MYDHHMHHPEGFDPSKPRPFGDDGMEIYPGSRKDCPICTAATTEAEPASTKPGKKTGAT